MLAQSCSRLHVVFVERDYAVDLLVSPKMRHSLHNVRESNLLRKIERVVQALPRPVGIAQLLRRKQENASSLALALAHELLPLLVGRNAQERQQARLWHGASLQNKPVRITWKHTLPTSVIPMTPATSFNLPSIWDILKPVQIAGS